MVTLFSYEPFQPTTPECIKKDCEKEEFDEHSDFDARLCLRSMRSRPKQQPLRNHAQRDCGRWGDARTSSRFQLASTLAQPVAAVPSSSRFSILGGFWIWPAPIIFAPTKVGNSFILSFQTGLGKTYTVQYTDTLAPPNWQNLPGVPGNGAAESVTNSAPGVAQRYYRLIEQ